MRTTEEIYHELCNPPIGVQHDIGEHLPTLRRYAAMVRHITEFGVRGGTSTCALLAGLADGGGGEMFSYDIDQTPFVCQLPPGVTWTFTLKNTRDFERLPDTGLLFIDADHKYESVSRELEYAPSVLKFIIMHDTNEERDRVYGDGVCRALDEFLSRSPEWEIIERYRNNNGLTVMKRK